MTLRLFAKRKEWPLGEVPDRGAVFHPLDHQSDLLVRGSTPRGGGGS